MQIEWINEYLNNYFLIIQIFLYIIFVEKIYLLIDILPNPFKLGTSNVFEVVFVILKLYKDVLSYLNLI